MSRPRATESTSEPEARRLTCSCDRRADRGPDCARREPDRAVPGHPAGGGAEGGPAAHRHRVRRVGADGQPRRRREAEVVLHLLVRPEAARAARRGGEAAQAAGGDRAHGRALRAAADDRLRARQPGLAVPHRARRERRVAAVARRRATFADVGLPPMPEYYRHTLANGKTRHGDGADDRVGLPHLPDRAAPVPVLRREGGVRLLRHQPQLAPAQAGGPPVHGRQAGRGRARGARRSSTGTTRRRRATRTRSPAARSRRPSTGSREADFYGRYAQAIEERFPGRWIGKVVAQALPKAEAQRFKDYGITIYHPNYEVWDKRLFSIISPGKQRYVGREEWHRRIFDAAEIFGARHVIPNFVAGVEMARAVRLRVDRRGDREHDRGARLLHEPRHHAALHDVVPRADDAARPRQPGRRAARVPRAAARARTATRCERHGLEPPPGYGKPGAGNAVFSVSSFMDVL